MPFAVPADLAADAAPLPSHSRPGQSSATPPTPTARAALPLGQGELPAPRWLGPSSAHTAGLFLALRAGEAYLWPAPFAQIGIAPWYHHYRDAFTRPPIFDPHTRAFEWDHDRYTINVFGHGLLGSELYYRPRRCGASPWEALAFAAGASLTWEYAFEGNGVRPSALDLVYTPLSGFVLGEGRYWGWTLAGRVSSPTLRSIVRSLFDPLGEFERALGAPC